MQADPNGVEPNQNGSRRLVVRHRIRDDLQQMILDGKCRPGTKLVQQQLAKQFGVAQSVIREALLELQACGLVEAIDNRGIFVSELDADKLIESFDVRQAHERLAVRLCCEHTTRAELHALAEMAEQMCSLGEAGQDEQMASLDREFHQQLLQLAGNSMLIRLAENYRVLGKVVRAGRDPKAVRDEHLAILVAIEANDPQKAEHLISEHIQSGKRAVEEQVKSGNFIPQWVV